jgi:hypothetical protein
VLQGLPPERSLRPTLAVPWSICASGGSHSRDLVMLGWTHGKIMAPNKSGSRSRETEVERTDLETIIDDFVTGQFNNPVRVVASTHLSIGRMTSRKISRPKSNMDGVAVPEHVRDFVDTHTGPARQLTSRLA